MLDDAMSRAASGARTGPGGQRGNDSDSSAAGSHPHTDSSDKPLPGPAITQPRTPLPGSFLTQRGAMTGRMLWPRRFPTVPTEDTQSGAFRVRTFCTASRRRLRRRSPACGRRWRAVLGHCPNRSRADRWDGYPSSVRTALSVRKPSAVHGPQGLLSIRMPSTRFALSWIA
jgi:hypothetical protein